MKIKKAVIAAAGLGTRVLPASKSVPKEMLNIVDKPAIHYIVQEILDSGIEQIAIILSRGKSAIEDYFDRSLELENALLYKNMKSKYDDIMKVSNMGDIVYIRQKTPNGLGGAVLCAESFVGNEPFVVAYADDVIYSADPVCEQLCRVYDEYGMGVLAIREVEQSKISSYSSVSVKSLGGNIFRVDDMVEKPKMDELLSSYSIFGRCVLPPTIFSILKNTKFGAGGELQLTDAMKFLANTDGMLGVDFKGKCYDMGSKVGVLKANVEYALRDEEIKTEFLDYLKNELNYLQ